MSYSKIIVVGGFVVGSNVGFTSFEASSLAEQFSNVGFTHVASVNTSGAVELPRITVQRFKADRNDFKYEMRRAVSEIVEEIIEKAIDD